MYFFDEQLRQPGRPPRRQVGTLAKGSSSAYWIKQQMLEEKAQLRRSRAKVEVAIEKEIQYKRLKSLDRAYDWDNPLSGLTQDIIDELHGKSKGEYASRIYGKKLTVLERHDVARAMVVAEQKYGLLDRISANLTEKALWDFSLDGRRDAPFLTISTRGGAFSWKQLLRDPLKDYSLGGRGRWSDVPGSEPIARKDSKLELLLADGNGPVKLKLSVLQGDQGLRWSLRGSSVYRAEHRELLSKLNAILEDYAERLRWMQQYRDGWAVPAVADEQIKKIEHELSIYYDLKPRALDQLRQRMLLAKTDEPIEINRRYSPVRIYLIRCSECGRVSKLDIKECLGSRVPKDWSKRSDLLYTPSLALEDCNPILSEAHRASSCLREQMEGINPRTGSTVDLRV